MRVLRGGGAFRAVGVLALIGLLSAGCSSGLSGSGRLSSDAAAPAALGAAGGSGGASAPGASSAASPASSAAAPMRAKVAFTAFSPGYLPLWLAQDAGYFREQGLDVELTQVAGGPALLAAMRSGELDIVFSGGGHLVVGYLQGLETYIFGSSGNAFEGSLMSRPEIRSVEDLRGKMVGVTRPNSVSDQTARKGLQRVGIQPDVDVTIISTGGNAESQAALENGLTQAASVNAPFTYQLGKRGFYEVLKISEMKIPFVTGAIGSTRTVLDTRPELADGFLRAVAQGVRRIQTDTDFSARVLGKYTQMDDLDILRQTIEAQKPMYQPDLYPATEAVQAVLDEEENPNARTARPEQVVDYRFVERLRSSGFLEQLAR
jgi:NitT/TauT family transport system substrate-binding protein